MTGRIIGYDWTNAQWCDVGIRKRVRWVIPGNMKRDAQCSCAPFSSANIETYNGERETHKLLIANLACFPSPYFSHLILVRT